MDCSTSSHDLSTCESPHVHTRKSPPLDRPGHEARTDLTRTGREVLLPGANSHPDHETGIPWSFQMWFPQNEARNNRETRGILRLARSPTTASQCSVDSWLV